MLSDSRMRLVVVEFFFFCFETFLFILDYILRPRSVLPPDPVKDLCSAYIGIHLLPVLVSYETFFFYIAVYILSVANPSAQKIFSFLYMPFFM